MRSILTLLLKVGLLTALFLVAGTAGSVTYFAYVPEQKSCLSCHADHQQNDAWTISAHRGVQCVVCHGRKLRGAMHAALRNVEYLAGRRFNRHQWRRLREDQVVAMQESCRECHPGQYADWQSSGHSMTYVDLLLDKQHNSAEQLADGCLRCHGVFLEGPIRDAVEPLSVNGPWNLKDQRLASRPAIPCLTCHRIHAESDPTVAPREAGVRGAGPIWPRKAARAGLYCREERSFIGADQLSPVTVVSQNQPVEVSDDPFQRVCFHCHAPNALHEAGTSDDRTPLGVHQGIGCRDCHRTHARDASDSCSSCHPRQSHCGLDVETMNTTFIDPGSAHNIHTVRCIDCHPQGRPQPK